MLQCPQCGSELGISNGKIICDKSHHQYDLLDGKYIDLSFLRKAIDWEQLNAEQYQELFSEINNKPWNVALRAVLLKHWGKYLADYNTSPNRYTYIDKLCPTGPEATILDIGCGFGNTSFALARKYQRVIAVDTPDNIIRWVNTVAQKEKQDNLAAIKIENLDFSPLPFKDNSFDMVILGMTLQWIGSFNLEVDPDEVQKRLIKEVFRILKKGGALVFIDTNRYMYRHFLGEVDSSALPYATLLPRRVANWYASIMKRFFIRLQKSYVYVNVSLQHNAYRNFKHTYAYLEKMFKACGFTKCYSFIPLPGVRFQQEFVTLNEPLKAEKFFGEWFAKNAMPMIKGHLFIKFLFWLMIRLKLSRFLADGYLIFALK